MAENKRLSGTLRVRGKGTGFVQVIDREEDILVENEHLSFGLDGDIVEVELFPLERGKRQAGKIVTVLESKEHTLIGTLKELKQNGRQVMEFVPNNRRLHIRPIVPDYDGKLLEQMVVVEITKWSNPHQPPLAKVTNVIGPVGSHETQMQAILLSGGFSGDFPAAVSEAAKKLYDQKSQIFKDAEQDEKRRDMRGVTTFTIDPSDAKDFDDALSVRTLENGLVEVGIHIADVSHYVRENDPIDVEARERGTSVYLVDRVIPMLPEVLSNDLCSLRPNEDRLAFSAIYELDANAQVQSAWYGQTIIHSDKRFSYQDAQDVLDKQEGPFLSELNILMRLSGFLRTKRYQAGAIAFEQPEVKFELDEQKRPVRVYAKERTETMMMIEDFMLLANQEVATHIHSLAKSKGRDAAFVYRIHDVPDPDKIEELATFLHALGYEFKTNQGLVKATDINQLLSEVEGKPEETLIKTATIRSMAKAVYSTKNIGHFGLAFKFYTHFTSPIRRYPDLMVHRLLRRHLDGKVITPQELTKYEKLSVQSSEREIDAVSAERNSIKYKQVEYMLDKVGQEFDGIITGVTDWGIYVEEKESKAEGMVRLASIGSDYYTHDPKKYHVKGEKTGQTYRLGSEVKIRLTRADLEEKQLDFELV